MVGQKVSVLYITPLFSGTPTPHFARFHDIIHHAEEHGINATIVTLNYKNPSQEYNVLSPSQLSFRPLKLLSFYRKVASSLRDKEYDVVHIVSVGLFTSPISKLLVELLSDQDIPVVLGPNISNFHHPRQILDYPEYGGMRNYIKSIKFFFINHLNFLQSYDYYMYHGSFHREYVKRYWGLQRNSFIARTRVPSDLFSPTGSTIVAQTEATVTIGILDSDTPCKHTELAYEAVKRCSISDIQIVTIGGGTMFDGEGDLDASVTQLGYLDRTEMAEFFRSIDVFVFPSSFEEGPTIVAESLASGCPIITTDIFPHHEILNHGENALLFENRSVRSLAEAIEECVESIDQLQSNAYSEHDHWQMGSLIEDLREKYKEMT